MGDSPDAFKTPKIDNIFEMHSEFQSASPQVKQFDEGVDATVELRASKVAVKEENPEEQLVPTREKDSEPPQPASELTFNKDLEEALASPSKEVAPASPSKEVAPAPVTPKKAKKKEV